MSGFILGGGVTGLAAGVASGLPVCEAVDDPGGICSSYYVRPGDTRRLHVAPDDEEVYRFEIGGGHWIFGGDPVILRFIRDLAPVKRYTRRSAVFFPDESMYVPYPLQNNLRFLDQQTVARALAEMADPPGLFSTMKDWQREFFGPTLCAKFFYPFHELYTAGMHDRIAPQDAYKSPVNIGTAIRGAFDEASAVGYNVSYAYPVEGLNTLAQRMAAQCDIRYGKHVTGIDPAGKVIHFGDGTAQKYDILLNTLPLNKTIEMTGLEVDAKPDPYTSVLVLNIGAVRGERCPDDHWLYIPATRAGFHRVGFYSNVDVSFLPASRRQRNDGVSIYVERAYVGGNSRPSEREFKAYGDAVVKELQEWGYIGAAEVVDPTWIDVAYTWAWPGSTFKPPALRVLEEHEIYQVGRYARWVFQGIADSIRDGFMAGTALRSHA